MNAKVQQALSKKFEKALVALKRDRSVMFKALKRGRSALKRGRSVMFKVFHLVSFI
jgi:hypothetical protein